MEKTYKDINIVNEIENKINTLNRTRNNRIEMSKRLDKYNEKWKAIFFCLNIEAVIFILLALGSADVNDKFADPLFSLSSGIFSIYVILLQYYINILNYKERALKIHYHQLDIEDLILKLKNILLRRNIDRTFSNDMADIREYQIVMFEYQAFLKNNENHSSIDDLLNQFFTSKSKVKKEKEDEKKEEEEKGIINAKEQERQNAKPLDWTLDNMILHFNMVFVLLLIIGFVLVIIF